MKLARKALVHFSFLGLRFILNCGFLASELCLVGGLTYVLVAFCYEVRQLGSTKVAHETVHLQNLNCLASLRTKVMPARVSSERARRKSWQMYPSRDRRDANRSNLAHILIPHLSCSKHGGLTSLDPHLYVVVKLFKTTGSILEISCEYLVESFD